ncbi:hypothetical protein CRUP_038320 [Coryphaenoides rupestris]|nr:hypothetical protein CRUP_038320 [Coryphaenoides rupestris]
MTSSASLRSLGAKVVLASSGGDDAQPPAHIVDGDPDTFWMSTGMFPQEFIIRLAEPTAVELLKGTTVSHLRFIITSGYDHFVSVHRVSIQTLGELLQSSSSSSPPPPDPPLQPCSLNAGLRDGRNQ